MQLKAPKPERLEAETAVDVVAGRIREGIFLGRYAIGQRLIEAELTAEYAVSRHTLRAALARLEAEGLVEISTNRGATVRRLTRKALADLFDLRATLDAYGARRAAQRIDLDKNRARLETTLKVWKRPDVLRDVVVHLSENGRFHNLLFEMSGNERLPELVRQLQVPGYRLRFRLLLTPERLAHSCADHVAIGNAILAGDARKAEAHARAHNEWSGSLLQSLPDTDFSP
jgi:DNA-binding GntR family transcriptional regulator